MKKHTMVDLETLGTRDPYGPRIIEIGCILTDPRESMATIAARAVSSEAFYDIRHRTIFETVVAMSDKNEPLDFITIIHSPAQSGSQRSMSCPRR